MKRLIIKVILFTISIMFLTVPVVNATGISDVITGGDSFIKSGESSDTTIDKSALKSTSDSLYKILLISAICIAVVIAAVLGIKFMIGSVEEKAKIKDSMVPFIIGFLVAFGAFGIWELAIQIGNNFLGQN